MSKTTIEVSKKTLKKLKLFAVKNDVTVKSVTEEALQNYLTRNKKGVKS